MKIWHFREFCHFFTEIYSFVKVCFNYHSADLSADKKDICWRVDFSEKVPKLSKVPGFYFDSDPMKQKNDFKTSFEVLIHPFAHVEERQNVTPVRLLSKPVIL